VSRIPALGPRGEGWVALQAAAIALVILAGRVGAPVAIDDDSLQGLTAVIGNLFVVAGLLVILVAAAVLRSGGAFTVFPRPIPGGQLVESGPFRFVRHPVYTGLIVAAFGSMLVRPSLLSLLAAALIFVVLDLKRRREEEWLHEQYPGYAAYRTRTKALIPWIY
jgi:protein-S-isoprenylcysteine O-methyltransferase Ste14